MDPLRRSRRCSHAPLLRLPQAQRQEKRAVKASTSDRDASLLVPRVANMFREALDFKGEAVVPFQAQLADLEKATLGARL